MSSASPSRPRNPAIASYVADFLKVDQNHVYRQLTGLRYDLDMHVFTHNRERPDHFPYHEKWMHILPKPRLRWWRRLVHRSIRKEPWHIFRWELRRWVLDLSRIEAQLLHVYFGHVAPQFLPLMQAWTRPVVVSYHGADAGVDMDKPRYAEAQRKVFQLAAQVQCRSRALMDDLVKLGCPEEKLVLQRTGIPMETWTPVRRTAPADGAWILCQSCRLIEKKGLDTSLAAFAQVRAQWPKARFIICGNGPLKDQLMAQAQALGVADAVEFRGFTGGSHMLKALHDAHLYLHPSRVGKDGNREGVPNALLEAMATALPCVATYHGGIPEAIEHEKHGLLVPENDSPALAAAVLQILGSTQLRECIGRAAHHRVAADFSAEGQSRSLLQHYNSLMWQGVSCQK